MRYLLIAVTLGLATIFVSVFFLHNENNSFETDSNDVYSLELLETYEGESYDFTPTQIVCDDYISQADKSKKSGCVLLAQLENTSDFEMILNLDGDYIIDSNGQKYESSDSLSGVFIEDNGFDQTIQPGESVDGGIFFEAPAETEVAEIGVYENASDEPIVITL